MSEAHCICRGLVESWPPPRVRDQRKVTWQTDEEVRSIPSTLIHTPLQPCVRPVPERGGLCAGAVLAATDVMRWAMLHQQRQAACLL